MSWAAAVGYGANLTGGMISAYSQYQAGKAEKAAYQYSADAVLQQTQEKEEEAGAKFSVLIGRQRSLYAKAGVDITSGSPLLIAIDTAMQRAEETGRIHRAGEQQAKLLRYYGKMAKYAGTIGAISTALSAIGGSSANYASSRNSPGYPATQSTYGSGSGIGPVEYSTGR